MCKVPLRAKLQFLLKDERRQEVQSNKPVHKPDAKPKPYRELLVDAMRYGLGMPYPNDDGKWQWYDVDLAEHVDCSLGSIHNWKNGVSPSAKKHASLVSVLTNGEPHASEWKLVFDQAWRSSKGRRSGGHVESTSVASVLNEGRPRIIASEENFRLRLAGIKNYAPCIIGPSYLDIILYPVSTNRLYPDVEYSNIDMPEFILGGSSVFIGRYYQRIFGAQSEFFTTVPGSDHPLSALWVEMVSRESWIKELHAVGKV